MIEITRVAELYQQQDGSFKFAAYFNEDFAEKFLSLKRIAKEKNLKMGLVLMVEKADVQPFDEIFLSEVEADIERVLEKIKGRGKNGSTA